MKQRRILLLLLLQSLLLNSTGQNTIPVYPLVKNFTVAETGGLDQNWEIVQDSMGLIYVANQGGVLTYDGADWNHIQLENSQPAYAMALHPDQTLYIGCVGDFGKLVPDSTGSLVFQSLKPLLHDQADAFNQRIFQVIIRDSLVHYHTYYQLITYHVKENRVSVIDYPDRSFRSIFIDGEYYVSSLDQGLLQYVNGSFTSPPGAAFFVEKRILSMQPVAANEYYVFTQANGIYTLDITNGRIEPVVFDAFVSDILTTGMLYDVSRMTSGDYCLGTLYGGCLIMDPDLSVIRHLDQKSGIGDPTIICCYPSSDGDLWMGLNSGVSRIELDKPVGVLGQRNQLEGLIWDFVTHEGHLFVATTSGLFYCDLEELSPVFREITTRTGTSLGQTISIEIVEGKNQPGLILAGSMRGMVALEIIHGTYQAKYLRQEHDRENTGVILQGKFNQAQLYQSYEGGVYLNEIGEKAIILRDSIPISNWMTNLLESSEGELWSYITTGVIYRFDFNIGEVYKYDLPEWLDVNSMEVFKLEMMEGAVCAFTTEGIMEYVPEHDSFQRSSLFNDIAEERNNIVMYAVPAAHGEYLASYYPESGAPNQPTYCLLRSQTDTTFEIIDIPEIPSVWSEGVFLYKEGIAWFAFNKNLYAVNTGEYLKNLETPISSRNMACSIRRIMLADSLIIYGGFDPGLLDRKIIPYKQRNPRITWALPSYNQEEKTTYRYRLEGRKEIRKSVWDQQHEVQFINLPPGRYTFHGEARNVQNRLAAPASFSFSVPFPWYLTIYMKLVYVGLFVFLLWRIVNLYNRRLIRDKAILAERVDKATHEIIAQKDIIEEKNRQITSSIDYAKYIQESILLPEEQIKELLPEIFIYNQPRDIVSGDFYWCSKVSDTVIIAAVDCTGHGVPGAFMSMIGSTLLDDIVNGMHMIKPSDILKNMHRSIRKLLRQEELGHTAQDGMDLSLCAINLESNQLQYAGARNSIYVICDGELREFQADPWSIGGLFRRRKKESEPVFTNNEIPVTKNCMVYMFTDGYMDQFGGEHGEKFGKKKFQQLLLRIHDKHVAEQRIQIELEMNDWQKTNRQLDDMLVIGFGIQTD